jgi:hypothetical protein
MKRSTAVVILACASFILGAVVPWLPPSEEVRAVASTSSSRDVEVLSAQEAAPVAEKRTKQGVLALGDDRMHDARECLEDRGVNVHPRIMRSAEEVIEAAASAAQRYSAILVHIEGDERLVDGHIERLMAQAGPGTRVVWATVSLDAAPWGAFSPEERINASIRSVITRGPQGRLLDWQRALQRNPEWNSSGASMTSTGCEEYARKVVKLAGMPRPDRSS